MRIWMGFLMLAITFLGGCKQSPITEPDIAGVWLSGDGAELRFEINGKFSGSKLPRKYVIWPDQKGNIESGAGSWNIRYQESPLHGGPELELIFEQNKDFPDGSYGATLYVSGEGADRTLYFWSKGDPDYEFKKIAPQPPS